jgi:phytoene dehydrogenase-like protein
VRREQGFDIIRAQEVKMDPITGDVLIVGAGMAGLTAAAYLSRAGLKVLLCEKENRTGGLVNSFDFNGFTFDGGIRAIENSGMVIPMLRQLGIEVEFLPSPVSIGIGRDVVRIDSKDSLGAYQELLEKYFPENKADIAGIIQLLRQVMGYMDVLYGLDNPLFMDLTDLQYVSRTILPWMLKYALTMPKIEKLYKPVDEYLAGFTKNKELIDIIAQHFFQKTPAFFALSYFSLYLEYRYPRGGTGTLTKAMEQFIREKGADIRLETEITQVDPGKRQATDAKGNVYQYRKLLWAADLKRLYRVVYLESLADKKAVREIRARQEAVEGKVGGDSVFTLYLTLSIDKAAFAEISSPHFFYTPSTSGLSHASLDELINHDLNQAVKFVDDKFRIVDWLRRFLDLNTYEISIPVLRDSNLAPQGQTGIIISTLFDYSLTKHVQAMGWYDEFKKIASKHILEVLDGSIYPGLKAAVIESFSSTPLTIERISGNSEGAITGWAFTNDPMPAVNRLLRVASSVETPIPDTYQAGSWTYSPSGMPISILTGKVAADRILKDLK